MSYLNSFLMSFCVSAIFIGAVFLICPGGKMSKPVKYILTLVFTVVIITSVSNKNFDLDFSDFKVPTVDTDGEELKIQSAEYVLGEVLRQNGVNFSKITVCTTKAEDSSIVISKVIIFSQERDEKILDALSEIVKNYEVEIKNE